jgi:hypothetical protein
MCVSMFDSRSACPDSDLELQADVGKSSYGPYDHRHKAKDAALDSIFDLP